MAVVAGALPSDTRPFASLDTRVEPPEDGATELCPGRLIGGKYRILRHLDEGAMATLWVARNEDLDADVVLKVVRVDIQSAETQRQLAVEARATARIEHPAIVKVFDLGRTEQGNPYIVLEFLHGECLDVLLHRESTLDPESAVQLLLPIAHGLTVVHQCGIVHRDLKPANLFVAKTASGGIQPKILDFGIARVMQKQGASVLLAGSIMGSPEYMSPEQVRGEPTVDGRADVWALCVMLCELVAGRTPFVREGVQETLRAVLDEESHTDLARDVTDPALRTIIARGLEKRPEYRWASMREFGTALARWLMDRGVAVDATGASIDSIWLSPDGSRRMSSFPPVALSQPDQLPTVTLPEALLPAARDVPQLLPRGGSRRPGFARTPRRWMGAGFVVGLIGGLVGWTALSHTGGTAARPLTGPASAAIDMVHRSEPKEQVGNASATPSALATRLPTQSAPRTAEAGGRAPFAPVPPHWRPTVTRTEVHTSAPPPRSPKETSRHELKAPY